MKSSLSGPSIKDQALTISNVKMIFLILLSYTVIGENIECGQLASVIPGQIIPASWPWVKEGNQISIGDSSSLLFTSAPYYSNTETVHSHPLFHKHNYDSNIGDIYLKQIILLLNHMSVFRKSKLKQVCSIRICILTVFD